MVGITRSKVIAFFPVYSTSGLVLVSDGTVSAGSLEYYQV